MKLLRAAAFALPVVFGVHIEELLDAGDAEHMRSLQRYLTTSSPAALRDELSKVPQAATPSFDALRKELEALGDDPLSRERAVAVILASRPVGERAKLILVSDFDATMLDGYGEFFERALSENILRTAVNPGWAWLIPGGYVFAITAASAAYGAFKSSYGLYDKHRPEYGYDLTLPAKRRLHAARTSLQGKGHPFDVGMWTVLLHMQTITLGYDFALCTGHVEDSYGVAHTMDTFGKFVDMERLRGWTREIHSDMAFDACKELGLIGEDVTRPHLPDDKLKCIRGEKGPAVMELFQGYDQCVFIDDTESRLDEVRRAFDKRGLSARLDLVNAAPPGARAFHELDRIMTRCQGTCADAYRHAVNAFWKSEKSSGRYVLIRCIKYANFVDQLVELLDAPSAAFLVELLEKTGAEFIVPTAWLVRQPEFFNDV